MGLSSQELQVIRDGLTAGRKPRVQFTEAAGQMAGQIGQVIELADPAVADEWVVVRFGRDELPFSPGDLRVAPRGAAARKATGKPAAPAPVVPAGPEFVLDRPAAGSGAAAASGPAAVSGAAASGPAAKAAAAGAAAKGSPASGTPATLAPASGGAAAGAARPGGSGASARVNGHDGVGAPAPRKGGDDVTAAATPRKAAGRARAKAPAGLTVTLAYGDGEWTVAASQGAKVLAKPYVVRPAEALRMVSLVDVPGVQEAVEQILATERAEAEEQARRLRAELAEVEARLQELGETP